MRILAIMLECIINYVPLVMISIAVIVGVAAIIVEVNSWR